MAASMVNHISVLLRNSLCRPFHRSYEIKLNSKVLLKPSTESSASCIPVRCSSNETKNNHQKPLLNWPTNRDYNHRLLVKQYGPLRQRLNVLRKNNILPKELQEIASAEIHALPRRSSVTHTYPRCIVTGKAKGRLRRWRMGRMPWRLLAEYNKLSGVTRAKW